MLMQISSTSQEYTMQKQKEASRLGCLGNLGWRKGKILVEESVKFLLDATCKDIESGSRMAVRESKSEDFVVRSL
jgi:hypothetical protein